MVRNLEGLPIEPQSLEETARCIRQLVLQTVYQAGVGHIGGPLSTADILSALYFKVLRIDPSRPNWPDRDRFVLSKGHAAIAWYATLALRGYFSVEELHTFDAIDSRLQGHPDMTVTPGVDISTGSLGQGLSAAVGMALGARIANKDFHTWVMLGDGEMQEGQIWEAIQVAARYHLDNLTAILDHNKLSQYGWTNAPDDYRGSYREPPITHPGAKCAAFDWRIIEIDGHDIPQILIACELARKGQGVPTLIVAHTVKGKGVSFMEGQYIWHSRPMTEDHFHQALAELQAPDSAGKGTR